MEDLGSLWTTYHESTDELKQKLLFTTLELESVKTLATDEIRKSEENVNNLLNLLKVAYKERDDARAQLHKLLNKIMPSNPIEAPINMFPHVQPESPLVIPTKANSSITESNSLSETYNHQSHGSSPVESLFDAVSSPEFSNINMADSGNIAFVKQQQQQPLVQEFNDSMSSGVASSGMTKTDPASVVIDNFVRGKTLPQKGKLLQAVMEAGPLLQTLLVAGPLPRWRNPPPLQSFKIPPVSIKGCEAASFNQKPVANPSYGVHNKPLSFASYPEMSRGFSQTCSASMLNFNNGASGSCLNNARLLTSNSSIDHQIPIGKRQRLQ
ncbi:uncharacterized protein LOC110762059 [Prunus avium]|uniref:Uncharacterized protein LOC110762059 n=1 Tax=Prunus avium TaxID=42229 RepID=A0A6P5T1P3_PRUAV|nr:uncharacterized protein LOC110762059 [Prunus avium]